MIAVSTARSFPVDYDLFYQRLRTLVPLGYRGYAVRPHVAVAYLPFLFVRHVAHSRVPWYYTHVYILCAALMRQHVPVLFRGISTAVKVLAPP